VPAYVTGPATKACGGCHRAQMINEDQAGGLAVLLQHFRLSLPRITQRIIENVCCLSRHHRNATPRLPRMWSSNTTSAGLSAIPRHTWSGIKCSSRG
jgi:hypothetical protein